MKETNKMKKLMIAAAIVCAAVVTQAANYNWGFSSSESLDPTGVYLEGGSATLYIGSAAIASAEQDPEFFTFGSFDLSASDSTGAVQTLGTGDISSTFAGQAYKIIVTYNDGTDDWTYTYNGTSQYIEVPGAAGQPSNNYETFVTEYAIQQGDWVKAVPEPTSGLLLLLGMAGLALRRRRA